MEREWAVQTERRAAACHHLLALLGERRSSCWESRWVTCPVASAAEVTCEGPLRIPAAASGPFCLLTLFLFLPGFFLPYPHFNSIMKSFFLLNTVPTATSDSAPGCMGVSGILTLNSYFWAWGRKCK